MAGVNSTLKPLNKPYDQKSVEWATPAWLFEELDSEFDFTLDPCAQDWNAKCERFFTIEDNGLMLPWSGRVFMNPPYAHNVTARWVHKALLESRRDEVEVVVGLIPARTDGAWFHDFIWGRAEVRFLRGRIAFDGRAGETKRPVYGSMVVVWR